MPERLFLALWPDAGTRAALAAARPRLPRAARPVPAGNLHLTLAFLGTVDAATRERVEAAAAAVAPGRFDLVLDRFGAWPRAGVAWLAPAAPPPGAADLAGRLAAALAGCGFAPERREFSPHVTVARRVSQRLATIPVEPIAWRVDAFHLVASDTAAQGTRYRLVRSWPTS